MQQKHPLRYIPLKLTHKSVFQYIFMEKFDLKKLSYIAWINSAFKDRKSTLVLSVCFYWILLYHEEEKKRLCTVIIHLFSTVTSALKEATLGVHFNSDQHLLSQKKKKKKKKRLLWSEPNLKAMKITFLIWLFFIVCFALPSCKSENQSSLDQKNQLKCKHFVIFPSFFAPQK